MKSKFLHAGILIFILMITISSNAQSWLLTGNSGTNTSLNFIGTKDNKGFVLRTSNIERMRITSTGLVGIANGSPTHAILEINNSVGAAVAMFGSNKNGVAIEADNPEIGFNYYYNGGTKTIKAGYASFMGMDPASGDIYVGNFNGNKSTANFGSITGVKRVITINQAGKVGIGTSTPQALLNVDCGTLSTTAIMGNSANVYGVEGLSNNSLGVYGYSENVVGVEGYSFNGYGLLAETGNANEYAAYLEGDVYASGTYYGSDEKLKKNISDFSDAINIINQLHPKYYEYRNDGDYKLMNLPVGKHYGLIAQDVEKVLPGLIKNTKFDTKLAKHDTSNNTSAIIEFKALNYTELIPVIIKGMQELNENNTNEVAELKSEIASLKSEIDVLKATLNVQQSAINISSAYLLQNSPNPFSKNTSIKCYVPSSANKAQLIIYTIDGKQLKTFSFNNNGMNEITVDANTLSPGEYIYSLLIDGKTIDSKHMILTK